VKPPRLGEGRAGRAPTSHPIHWHLPYNWGKSRKLQSRSARLIRTRFVLSTWPSRAMASTGLMGTAALRLRVKRLDQPSVSVGIYRVAVLGDSPNQLTFKVEARS